MKKKNYECILITTKDNRKLFTHKKNLNKLKEYAKVFDAELSVVQVKEADILDLEDLAFSLVSDTKCKNQKAEYKVIEKKTESNKKPRNKILNTAKKIKSFIKDELLEGKTVSVNSVLQKFKNEKITNACVCMHLKNVRTELSEVGVEINKIKHGFYKKN